MKTLSPQYFKIVNQGLGGGQQLFKQGWEKLRHPCRDPTGMTFIHVLRLLHSDGMLLFLVVYQTDFELIYNADFIDINQDNWAWWPLWHCIGYDGFIFVM